MERINALPLFLLLFGGCFFPHPGWAQPMAKEGGTESAWRTYWTNGDIEESEKSALAAAPSSERDHVLFNCAFAKGEYEKALAIFSALDPAYRERARLDETVIETYVHLGRFADAASYAKLRNRPKRERALLDAHAAAPLRVKLDGTTVLPFVPLPFHGLDFSDSLPGVETELEGKRIIAHFDSGGAFLVMSPEKAKSMGIALVAGERGFAGLSWGRMRYGIAKSFRIGDALLENVPVTAAPQLKGDTDRVYFGTAVLERFLATLDFPSRRLILSPRGDPRLRAEQLGMLSGEREEVPFYLWGDHFMFARGSLGDERGLNFFIDSGLFFAVADERGEIRRGALLASTKSCERWGMDPSEAKKGYFKCRLPVSLGSLAMESPYVVAGPMETISENFGGVRIDALLSNGFLGRYAWTIDFDRRTYLFTDPERGFPDPDD
jgi:hypothetical protein